MLKYFYQKVQIKQFRYSLIAGHHRHHRRRRAGRFHGAGHRRAAGPRRQGQAAGGDQPATQRGAAGHPDDGVAGLSRLRSHFVERGAGSGRHADAHHRTAEQRAGPHHRQRRRAQAVGLAVLHPRGVHPGSLDRSHQERKGALGPSDDPVSSDDMYSVYAI